MTSNTPATQTTIAAPDPAADASAFNPKRTFVLDSNPAAFTLRTLFQITTASAIFFACLRFSPLAAILMTLLFAPAIVRTGQISDIRRRNQMEFGVGQRILCFFSSIGVVALTASFAALMFVLISLSFGLLGMIFCSAVGSTDLTFDAAIVGTAGGMIWGFAGAMLAAGFAVLQIWLPREFSKA